MITITETARTKVAELLQSEEPGRAVRMAIRGRGAGGFVYDLRFVPESEKASTDSVVDAGPFRILIDAASVENMKGATFDYVETAHGAGFRIENPNPLWTDPLALAVQKIIDERINPNVAGHGGIVALQEVREGVAYISFGGGCHGCGMADVTLKQGVEAAIREAVPGIREVVDMTDHTRGAHPYHPR